MRKNKIIENIKIDKLWNGWVGIWTLEDWKKILVKWSPFIGSIVNCKVIKKRRDYIQAKLVEIKTIDKNILNKDMKCSHCFLDINNINDDEIIQNDILDCTKWCGWCKWQIIKYKKQLEYKESIIDDTFRKLKEKLKTTDFKPILPSPKIREYRNKIEFSFGKYMVRNKENLDISEDNHKLSDSFKCVYDWNLWFHRQWEFSKIIDIEKCFLSSNNVWKIYKYLKNKFKNSWLPVYDQKTHKWFFRHLVFREGFNTNSILINFSVSNDNLWDISDWNKKWNNLKLSLQNDEYLKYNIDTFVITYNNWLADVVKWEKFSNEILWGDWFIYEKLDFEKYGHEKVIFRISPFSFFQTNTLGAEILFSQAMIWYEDIKWTILDLYCGTGSIWISFLKSWIGKKLIWIEILEDAIIDASYNSSINGIEKNCYFVSWKAEKLVFTDNQLKSNLKDIELIIIDPPREWLHKDVVSFLTWLKKKYNFKLLYISCNPVTMARDIEWLIEWWFNLSSIQPVDMFSHTNHIETIGKFE